MIVSGVMLAFVVFRCSLRFLESRKMTRPGQAGSARPMAQYPPELFDPRGIPHAKTKKDKPLGVDRPNAGVHDEVVKTIGLSDQMALPSPTRRARRPLPMPSGDHIV
jgi:hypothetical protein